jgi:hypothetical protein
MDNLKIGTSIIRVIIMNDKDVPVFGTKNGYGERLKFIRGDMNRGDFARQLAVHSNTIGRWEREEQAPNIEDINIVLFHHPYINPTWLLTGEGEMKRGKAVVSPVEQAVSQEQGQSWGYTTQFRQDNNVNVDDVCGMLRQYGNQALLRKLSAALTALRDASGGWDDGGK